MKNYNNNNNYVKKDFATKEINTENNNNIRISEISKLTNPKTLMIEIAKTCYYKRQMKELLIEKNQKKIDYFWAVSNIIEVLCNIILTLVQDYGYQKAAKMIESDEIFRRIHDSGDMLTILELLNQFYIEEKEVNPQVAFQLAIVYSICSKNFNKCLDEEGLHPKM